MRPQTDTVGCLDHATTQAAVVRTGTHAREISVQNLPAPPVAADQVLIAVDLCGLCGSDAHIWRGDDGYEWVAVGRVLGHEVIGSIVAVGEAAGDEWTIGDRVVPVAQTGCGHCEACLRDYANGCPEKTTLGLSRDGGAAALVVADSRSLVRVPAGLPSRTAVLTEPASVAARAVRRGRITTHDRVVISGPGAVGILAAVQATDLGAEVILLGTAADVRDRAEKLRTLGITLAGALPQGFSPTVWIEAAGAAAALNHAAAALAPEARLVIVALYGTPPTLEINPLVRKEIDVSTSYSSFRPDYEAAITALNRHRTLGEVLVRPYPLHDAAEAFDNIGSGSASKVALAP